MFPIIPAGGSPFSDIKSLSLVGASNQEAKITDASFSAFTLSKWAISLWSKRASASNFDTIFSKWGVLNKSILIDYEDITNKIRLITSADGINNDATLTTTNTYGIGIWRNILIKFDSSLATSSRFQVDVDGANQAVAGTNPAAAVFNSAADVSIGSRADTTSFPYDGLINEVAFFDNVWPTDNQLRSSSAPADLTGLPGLKAWWRFENNALDSSGNGHTLTLVNSPTYSTDVP